MHSEYIGEYLYCDKCKQLKVLSNTPNEKPKTKEELFIQTGKIKR